MEIVSKANSVRISPKKLRKVANLVRGLNVNKALNSLSHMDEKGAAIILKTLSSAIANAEHNEGADIDDLKVVTTFVDAGPTMKRFRARARGRGRAADPTRPSGTPPAPRTSFSSPLLPRPASSCLVLC